jgi:(S)-ureidoglycine aminohydrolase
MKFRFTFYLILTISLLHAQNNRLQSKVYQWDFNNNGSSAKVQKSTIFGGKGGVLASHTMIGISIPAGKKWVGKANAKLEKFYIIKTGIADIELNDQKSQLNRGSDVCVLPGDKIQIKNNSNHLLQIYEMSYSAGEKINIERGIKAGGSFITLWDNIKFKPHERGGVRQFFDRPTAMLNRFDIHVTQLNVGFKSHEPHTHVNEEIILMLDGNAEMQIGTDHQKANPGDVVLLGSNILHNLTNVGNTACLYFAIQWN